MVKYYNSNCNKESIMVGMETGGEQTPEEVLITGGAGQIAYQLAPLVASGQTLGDKRVNIRLLEIPDAMKRAEGVAEELQDGAYPYLAHVDVFDSPKEAYAGATHVFEVGAMPRKEGMERADLLEKNAGIFREHGEALEEADNYVKVVVVGNPANSNALVMSAHDRRKSRTIPR
ncbi:MAG TPA: hypothetical protein VFX86_02515 [Candidatus Saccharimonadales bacterium]|nr:hypothetical protein [Candidatus Saccharimonadales bacterium]